MALTLALSLTIYLALVLASYHCALVPSVGSMLANSSAGVQEGPGANNTARAVATTWYAGWHATDFPPLNVSWSKYTSVIYAFATTTSDVSIISLQDADKQLLPQFVEMAHENSVDAILSIGGWTGSQYYSSAVSTADNRTTFVQAVLNLVTTFDLDGIDFDWEYPNRQGVGCNTISPDDSTNFLSFLQELREQPAGQNITLSAAVSITPFVGADGNPMSDVSEFAKVLDYVEIMNYDVWGSFSIPTSVGPNAPLNDTCASSGYQEGSAVSAIQAWTSASFPANQIVLGVASYGHSFYVPQSTAMVSNAIAAYPSFSTSQQPSGDKWDGVAGVDQCGNATPAGGIFDFWGLVDAGFIGVDGKVANGIQYRYDNCSQTPFVYNPSSQVMISYDDATSFAAKGRFISDMQLKGFAMWEAGGDYDDILLDSIRTAIGTL